MTMTRVAAFIAVFSAFILLLAQPGTASEWPQQKEPLRVTWSDYSKPLTSRIEVAYDNETIVSVFLPENLISSKSYVILELQVQSGTALFINTSGQKVASFTNYYPYFKINKPFMGGMYRIPVTEIPSQQSHQIKIKTKYFRTGLNEFKFSWEIPSQNFQCIGGGCKYFITYMELQFEGSDISSAKQVISPSEGSSNSPDKKLSAALSMADYFFNGFLPVLRSIINEYYPNLSDDQSNKIDQSLSDHYQSNLRLKLADLFMKYFNEEELEALSGFYSSPIGQSCLKNNLLKKVLSLEEIESYNSFFSSPLGQSIKTKSDIIAKETVSIFNQIDFEAIIQKVIK